MAAALVFSFPFAGARMLRHLQAAKGRKVGRRHVRTLMRRMGIEALYRRPRTTKPEPGHKIFPFLLRGLEITRPNQVWAMDITYIPMARGFVYLAVVLDWFSRRVLSWKLSITMEAAFCVEVVEAALTTHGKPEIFNTDQGSQFTGAAFGRRSIFPSGNSVRTSGTTSLCGRLTDRDIPFMIYSGYAHVGGACKDALHIQKPATHEALVAAMQGLISDHLARGAKLVANELRKLLDGLPRRAPTLAPGLRRYQRKREYQLPDTQGY